MDSPAIERLRARAQRVRTRAQVRGWEYRQRNLAAGVWFQLRRALADARAAYVIADEDARQLESEGYTVEACGRRLAPEKTMVFVDQQRLARIASRRSIPVGLGPEFLSAASVALVRFD